MTAAAAGAASGAWRRWLGGDVGWAAAVTQRCYRAARRPWWWWWWRWRRGRLWNLCQGCCLRAGKSPRWNNATENGLRSTGRAAYKQRRAVDWGRLIERMVKNNYKAREGARSRGRIREEGRNCILTKGIWKCITKQLVGTGISKGIYGRESNRKKVS